MDVSIVIVNYNTFELTCRCIQSIVEHTRGVTYQIIVVDNASTERSAHDFLNLFRDIVLIESTVNVGFAKGNNLGVSKAIGNYILLLNSDTQLLNDAISICYEILKHDERIGVVGSALFFPDGSKQHNCQRFPSIYYKLFELLRLQKIVSRRMGGKILHGFFFDHNEPVFTDWIWGTFFMFKRDSLKLFRGGKLPEDFFMYGEDMQWCMEYRKHNLSIAFEPKAKVIHHMGKSGAPKIEMMKRNGEKFMNLYYSRFERKIIKFLDGMLNHE